MSESLPSPDKRDEDAEPMTGERRWINDAAELLRQWLHAAPLQAEGALHRLKEETDSMLSGVPAGDFAASHVAPIQEPSMELRMLRDLISHWREFGPEYGFDEKIESFDRALNPPFVTIKPPETTPSTTRLTSDLKCPDGRPLLKELSSTVMFLDSEGAHSAARVIEYVATFLSTLSGKYDRFDAAKQVEEPSEAYVLRLLGRLAHLESQLHAAEASVRSATPHSQQESDKNWLRAQRDVAEEKVKDFELQLVQQGLLAKEISDYLGAVASLNGGARRLLERAEKALTWPKPNNRADGGKATNG